MGTQNKITEAYFPDKGGRKEKIIVGLSGGVDSLVAAYLLKIQKYDLAAVTIVPAWEEVGEDPANLLSCGVGEKKLQMIQKFCHQLGIPHSVIRLSGEFREKIVEKWIARKAFGEYPDQCISCHELRMEHLHQKMKELGGKFLATGHYAKVFRHDLTGVSLVQSSNDEHADQSGILSRVPQEILRDLILPLSDLQRKEVKKLAENFGLEEATKTLAFSSCFPDSELTQKYLETKLPERFRKEGGIFDAEDNRLADHEGVIQYTLGKVLMTTDKREDFIFSRYVSPERKILVQTRDWFKRDRIFLRLCQIPPETEWLSPFRAVLISGDHAHEGWFYPKTLGACFVVLDAPADLREGEILSVQKKKGKNSRVLLTGKVRFIHGPLVQGDTGVKVDYAVDF